MRIGRAFLMIGIVVFSHDSISSDFEGNSPRRRVETKITLNIVKTCGLLSFSEDSSNLRFTDFLSKEPRAYETSVLWDIVKIENQIFRPSELFGRIDLLFQKFSDNGTPLELDMEKIRKGVLVEITAIEGPRQIRKLKSLAGRIYLAPETMSYYQLIDVKEIQSDDCVRD